MTADIDAPHRAEIHGYGFMFYWACSCGRQGIPTTNGRAAAARDRHLQAANRRVTPPGQDQR